MHFQLNGNTYQNDGTQEFIDRKIRPDGFSTFLRDQQVSVPTDTPAVDKAWILSRVMGGSVPVERYNQLLPEVVRALHIEA